MYVQLIKRCAQCWSANVKGPLALMKAALPAFNANADGGALIITSSIAVSVLLSVRPRNNSARTHNNTIQATSQAGSSMAYSVTKTAQVQLMKCLAKTQGPKIRVNAVLPGLLLTEWVRLFPVD